MQLIIVVILSMIFNSSFASNHTPKQCKPLTLNGELIDVGTKKPQLLLIQNTSEKDVWITHPMTQPSASAGWSNRIKPHHWSAFAVNKTQFTLSCIESNPGHEQQIPCNDTVFICQQAIKNPKTITSTFWAAEDMALNNLLIHLRNRGFKVPDSSNQ